MSAKPGPPSEARFQSRAKRLHGVQGWLLALSATVLAASGQIEFAVSADITDLRRFLVPAILEIAAVFVLLGGYLRACEGDSPTLMWLLAAAITGFAVWTNLEHGGPRAGRIYAAATVLTFVLWLLKLRDHYRAARRTAGLVESPTARFRIVRWLVMPGLTRRAWLISVEYNLRDADRALQLARLWRDTVADMCTAPAGPSRTRRRAARRAAERAVRRAAASPGATHSAAEDVVMARRGRTPAAAGPPPSSQHRRKPAPGSDRSAGRRRRSQPGNSRRPTGHRTPGRRIVRHHLPNGLTPASPQAAAGNDATAAGHRQTRRRPATRPDPTRVYQPTNNQDAVMYTAWRGGLLAGREPSGADLANAAGRPNDSTGVGRRAVRRYRQAHAATATDVTA